MIKKKGKKALYISIRYDNLFDPKEKIFHFDKLNKGIYKKMNWNPRASGVEIPEDVAKQLEKDWKKFIKSDAIKKGFILPEEAEVSEVHYEGAKKRIEVNIYERNAKARKQCIQKYGLRCSVCSMNFEKIYGEIGKGYINVHHLKPLSEVKKEYKLDPIKDLRPICPNCHAMIHRREPALKIEELRKILKKNKK